MARSKKSKPARQKIKTFSKRGIRFEKSLTKIDLREAPAILRGFTAGDDEAKLGKIESRRDALDSRLSGAGGVRIKFMRPRFARRSATKAKRYDPRRAGRPRESYLFFPIFEFSIIQSFDTEKLAVRQRRFFNAIDNYDTLKRYFSSAKLGARAGWSVRPPGALEGVTGEYNIRQTLQSYRKHGLDKRKLRKLIRAVDDRLAGFAIVTGVRGVWRSPRSEQFAERKVFGREAASKIKAARGGFKARKPKRTRKV